MKDQLGESLSSLMDGEANELDLERVLKHSDDESLRGTWRRYHAASESMQPGAAGVVQDVDLSRRIMAALEQESAPVIRPVARWQQFLRPAASFAVAASVFAAVLVGSQAYSLLDNGSSAAVPVVAGRTAAGGVVNTVGGSAVQAGYASTVLASKALQPQQPVADYNALARKRLERYMLSHTEEAALNAPLGLMPYARVATFTTED
ncbi:MAG: sigma-E factor negative regulatory protein [Halieaceae bacterium]